MKKGIFKRGTIRKMGLLIALCICVSEIYAVQSDVACVYAITKSEAEKQKEEAEENEKDAKSVLEALEDKQNEIVQEVADLDSRATKIQTEISLKEDESEALQSEIAETKKNLADAQKAETDQYDSMKKRIQYLYEEGEIDYIDTLLSSVSFTDMLNNSEYIDQISSYDQKQLEKLAHTRSEIADYESSLESDLRQVEALKTDLVDYNNQLQETIAEKEEQISTYDGDIDAQEKLMAKFTAEREKLEAQIAEMSKNEANKAGTSTSGSVYTTDGKVYDSSKYSGRFMWPVSTGGTITDYFGYRNAPTAGASSYHQGLDIGCSYGTDIVAADDGTVIMSGYNGGAGNMVMISHEDGICTVYMHNSQLCVNVGENVVKGQVIAKAGSTGVSTGTHCHFGVQINGTYVDPLDFL